MTRTWVIGAGGLLGRAVVRALDDPHVAAQVPWSDPEAASARLSSELRSFADSCGDEDWTIIWAAGMGTVSTSREAMDHETQLVTAFVKELARAHPRGRGAFVLASSAGGVYAGSLHPPFDSHTAPCAISDYGRAKLAQESAATAALAVTCPVVLARISNLYGPDQDLDKMQGLISQLAKAAVSRQPVNIFVPLDTLRDYLYADDAGRLLAHWAASAVADSNTGSTVRVLASGESVSVAQLIGTMQDVARRRVPVALGQHPSSAAQVLDLRFRPDAVGGPVFSALTPLPVGLKHIVDGVRRQQQLRSTG